MKFYKVYAKCAYSAQPVKEISIDEVETCISDLIDYNLDEYSWLKGGLDEEEMNVAAEKLATVIYGDWAHSGYLKCGDYAIHRLMDDDEIPVRDNMCGHDLFVDDIE